MPAMSANDDAFMEVSSLKLHLVMPGAPRVLALRAHAAVTLDERDAAARLCVRHAHGVLERAPLAREIRDRDTAWPALVHAPDAILGLAHRKERRIHQLPPEGARAWITEGFSIGGRRISCSRLGRSRRREGGGPAGSARG